MTLGHTMMRVRTSMVAWEVAVSGAPLGRGTLPDVAAAMTLDDYRLGVDRVMQTAVDLLHN
ncbi:MAG: hypothetical protein MZU97_25975 [Bacillus subtilis]|nr:hypothetical protein [Bacillus subtilis]